MTTNPLPRDPWDQPDLFSVKALDPALDTPLAEVRRDAGIASSTTNAADEFRQVALDLMHEYALTHSEVWCDDFLAFARPRLPETHTLRALGGAYRTAVKKGWIEKTDEYRLSNTANRSPKVVWRSLIHRAEPRVLRPHRTVRFHRTA